MNVKIFNRAKVNLDLMKVYVIRNINGIMMNVCVIVKTEMIWVFVKMVICGILVYVIVRVTRRVKYIDIKNCSWEKHPFGKLVLACEDKILNILKSHLIIKK